MLKVDDLCRLLMLESLGLLEVFARLFHLLGVLLAERLHLLDGLLLVHEEGLVPVGGEILQLNLVLLFNLNLLAIVLVIERGLQSMAGLLSDFHDLAEFLLSLTPVALSFIHLPQLVQGVQVSLHTIDIESSHWLVLTIYGNLGDRPKV